MEDSGACIRTYQGYVYYLNEFCLNVVHGPTMTASTQNNYNSTEGPERIIAHSTASQPVGQPPPPPPRRRELPKVPQLTSQELFEI
jgi:hypothetical protein